MADQLPLVVDTSTGLPRRISSGDTIPVTAGGTGATTQGGARTNLGLAIGSDVQAYNALLNAIAALAANGMITRTGAGAVAARSITTANSANITVTNGDGASGNPTLDLATVTLGSGSSFVKINVDSYGRVSGTTNVVAGDLTTLLNTVYLGLGGGSLSGYLTLHADPTNPMHAATKQYVDARAVGMDLKDPVVLASLTPITIASPGSSIGGGTPNTGDRIGLIGQTLPAQNGIYIWNGAATPMTRATDADADSEVTTGMTFLVTAGTSAGARYTLTTTGAITVGTTALTFTQESSGASYSAGNGLTLAGSVFNVGSTTLSVTADAVDLATVVTANGSAQALKVQYDAYGRIISSSALTASDISAQASDADLTAIAAISTSGIIVRTGSGTAAARSITSSSLTVTNGDGVAGNISVELPNTGTAGTYKRVTTDAQGRVTAGDNINGQSFTNGSGSTIGKFKAVYVSAADTVNNAIANSIGTTKAIGFTLASATNGAAVDVALSGSIMSGTTGEWDAVTGQGGGLTTGALYFLSNTTSGNITTTAPTTGFLLPVGIAKSTTQFEVTANGYPIQL